MHKDLPKIYYFIDDLKIDEIKFLNKNIAVIYRNYKKKIDESTLTLIKNFCRKQKIKFYIAGNLKIARKLRLDGVYIPAFMKSLNYKNYNISKNFTILGSAHNQIEAKIKEKQGCDLIFIAPTFPVKKSKKYLGTSKFNLITLNKKIKKIALGGINNSNINKLNLLNIYGFAGISWVKKNGPSKLRPFLNCLNKLT